MSYFLYILTFPAKLEMVVEESLARNRVHDLIDSMTILKNDGIETSMIESELIKCIEAFETEDHEKAIMFCDVVSNSILELKAGIEKERLDRELIRLPFTHGIETELQVVASDGKWVPGNKMRTVFLEILLNTKIALEMKLAKEAIPDHIRAKVGCVTIETDKYGNDAVHVEYTVGDKSGKWNIIGKDSHVSFDTNILEIQTPPCEYLRELEWWLHTVFRITYLTIKKRKLGLVLIPTGLNPHEPFARGVSFGDHHHLSIPDEKIRNATYNILRNYLPHLIALNVNSPFKNGETPYITTNSMNNLVLPNGCMSSRLEMNNGQLAAVPELLEGESEKDFMEKTGKVGKAVRMVDLYPFTTWGTIEIRCIDSQLCLSSRISLAIIIQAIALKAKKLVEKGSVIPRISDETLRKNRENAIRSGLLATFFIEPEVECHGEQKGVAKKAVFMHEACQNMLSFLKEELTELNVIEDQCLHPIIVRLHGGKSTETTGLPNTPAQYQLYLYQKATGNKHKLLKMLDEVSKKCAESPTYDPMIELLGEPSMPGYLLSDDMDREVSRTC